jgi:hypothetical protein
MVNWKLQDKCKINVKLKSTPHILTKFYQILKTFPVTRNASLFINSASSRTFDIYL